MTVLDEGGVGLRIEGVWAYLAEHADGDEGVCGYRAGETFMPMIAADELRLELLEPIAKHIAEATGKPVRLVRFGSRVDVAVIRPASAEAKR